MIVIVAWPSRSETTFTGVPAANSTEACVCLRSWTRITGKASTPNFRLASVSDRVNLRLNLSGLRYLPLRSLKINESSRTRRRSRAAFGYAVTPERIDRPRVKINASLPASLSGPLYQLLSLPLGLDDAQRSPDAEPRRVRIEVTPPER